MILVAIRSEISKCLSVISTNMIGSLTILTGRMCSMKDLKVIFPQAFLSHITIEPLIPPHIDPQHMQ